MNLTVGSSPREATSSEFLKHIHKISRQSFVFLLGTLFTVGASYLFKIYLARVLGAEGLGIYALGMTAGGVVSILGTAGVPAIASRFVAIYAGSGQTGRLGRFLWLGTLSMLISNLVMAAGMIAARGWIANHLYHTPVLAGLMHFFAAIMVLGALTTFLGQVLGGYKDVARRTVITNFIGMPATMVFSIALLSLGFGLRGYLVGQVAGASVVLILLIMSVRKLTPPDARWPFGPNTTKGSLWLEREVLSFAGVAAAIQALDFTNAQSDRIVMGIYLNAREVGIYSVAISMVVFVALFLQAINQIFGPTIAELYAAAQHDLLRRLYQTLTKWSLGLSLPLSLGIMAFAKPLMRVFGPDFERGWPVLVIATLGQVVSCGVGSVGLLLFMSDQQKRMMQVQAVTVFLTLGLNFLLIPRWGLTGAAISVAATNISSNLLWLRDVRRKLSMSPSLQGYLSLLAPTALTVLTLFIARIELPSSLGNIVRVILGLSAGYAVFFISAVLFALSPDDRMLAENAYARLRGVFAG